MSLFRQTGIADLKIEALHHLELKSMDSIADVIDYARSLAGDDPVKAQLLSERIRNYARRLDRAQGIFGG